MISNKTVLELKKTERNYQLIVDSQSPLGEVYDVLTEMKSFVFQKIKDIEESQKKNEESENKESS